MNYPASFVQVVYSLDYLLEDLPNHGFVVHEAAQREYSLQVSQVAMLKDEEGDVRIVGVDMIWEASIRGLLHFMSIRGCLFIFGYCPRLNTCLDTGRSHFRLVLASCCRVNLRFCMLPHREMYLPKIKAVYHVSIRGLYAIVLDLDKAISFTREED